jgi:hypothetical protein
VLASATVVPVAAGPTEAGSEATAPVAVTTDPATAATVPSAAGAQPARTGAAPLPLPPGLTATLGSPVVASNWVIPNANGPGQVGSKLVITNVALDQPVGLTVLAWDGAGTVQDLQPAPRLSTLEPRRQIELPLPPGSPAELLVVVEATGPVVVEVVQIYGAPPDISASLAIPRARGVLVPDVLGVVMADLVGADTGFTSAPASTSTAPPTTAASTTTASTALAATTTPTTSTTAVPTTLAPPPTTTTAVTTPATEPPVTEPPASE